MITTIWNWGLAYQEAFKNIKAYLKHTLVHQSPKSGERIGVYLAHAYEALSSILLIFQCRKQLYFLKNKLASVDLMFPALHKVAFPLVH